MPRTPSIEKRLLREQERREKLERRKVRAGIQQTDKNTPRCAVFIEGGRELRVAEDAEDYLRRSLTWCRSKADVDGAWTWGQLRQWTDDEWTQGIEGFFNGLGQVTWANIMNDHKVPARDGKLVPKHHHQDVEPFCGEAIERWIERELELWPTSFRFRVAAKRRLYGIRNGSHFHLVWWDRTHDICPVEPSNT